MSGREIAVGAGLLIIAIGAISEADNQHPTPQVVFTGPKVLAPLTPKPVPTHTVVVHQVTTHIVTRVVSGSPLAGWQIMLIAIAAVIVVAGAFVAVQLRRLS